MLRSFMVTPTFFEMVGFNITYTWITKKSYWMRVVVSLLIYLGWAFSGLLMVGGGKKASLNMSYLSRND